MVDSTDTRPYVFAILQYKRSCLYLPNKDYRRKPNRLRTSVEDWRVDIYKWESCCFTGFRFSVPSRVKRELGVDRIGECRRVVREGFQEICLGRVGEGGRVPESGFGGVGEGGRVPEDGVGGVGECGRIVRKEFQGGRIVHVQFFVVVLVIRDVFFVLRLDLLIPKSCSCSVLITSVGKGSKGTCWKGLTVDNKLCPVFLCQFSALISTTLRQEKSSPTMRSNVRCVW